MSGHPFHSTDTARAAGDDVDWMRGDECCRSAGLPVQAGERGLEPVEQCERGDPAESSWGREYRSPYPRLGRPARPEVPFSDPSEMRSRELAPSSHWRWPPYGIPGRSYRKALPLHPLRKPLSSHPFLCRVENSSKVAAEPVKRCNLLTSFFLDHGSPLQCPPRET